MGKYKKYKRKKNDEKLYQPITCPERLTEEEKELVHSIPIDRLMVGVFGQPSLIDMVLRTSHFRCLVCELEFMVDGIYEYAQCPNCFNLVSEERKGYSGISEKANNEKEI